LRGFYAVFDYDSNKIGLAYSIYNYPNFTEDSFSGWAIFLIVLASVFGFILLVLGCVYVYKKCWKEDPNYHY